MELSGEDGRLLDLHVRRHSAALVRVTLASRVHQEAPHHLRPWQRNCPLPFQSTLRPRLREQGDAIGLQNFRKNGILVEPEACVLSGDFLRNLVEQRRGKPRGIMPGPIEDAIR